jgi:hypothetical protein
MGGPEPGAAVTSVDAFDLPEWLGVEEVTWTAATSLDAAARVAGTLSGPSGAALDCDVLASDLAYPRSVLEEKWRAAAHQAWQLGETQLLEYDGRLTLTVPGTTVGVELALDAVRRLARAVGAPSSRFTVAIRL